MKKILILFQLALLSTLIYAQSPDSINLQLQFFPINYENSSDVLFQFQKSSNTENNNFSFSIENNLDASIENVGNVNYVTNNYLISNLTPETKYLLHIYVEDESGNTIETIQSPVQFITENEGMINVSTPLFNSLSDWSVVENQSTNILDLFSGLTSVVSEYELIYFIQRYLYEDTHLNEPWTRGGDIGKFPLAPKTRPEGNPPFPPKDDCLCKFVINRSAFAIPHGGRKDCDYIPINKVGFDSDPEKTWWLTSKIGAAHFAQIWQDGKHDSDHDHKGTIENANSGFSPEYLGLNWNYLCTNYPTNLPFDCECEKEIVLNWKYETNLISRAPDQFFTWDDGSHASAQDYALLVESDENGNFDILGAGRAIVTSTCNTDFNPDFLKPLASFVESIGEAIQNVSAETIAEVINSLNDVITTDFVKRGGDCQSKDESTTLTKGFKTIFLEPNVAKKIRLYSFFDVDVGGYGKFKPLANVASDCYVNAVLKRSNDDDSDACCSDKHASWVIGRSLGSPNTIVNLKEEVGADIKAFGPWPNYPSLGCDPCTPTVICDADCITKLNPNCNDKGEYTGPDSQYKLSLNNDDNLDFSIFPNPSTGILNINFTSLAVEVGTIELFSSVGQSMLMLFKGEFQKNNKLVLTLPEFISPGQYIVKVKSENINHISKIIISK